MALSFRILGPLEVSDEGRQLSLGRGRQRALLALLVVHANELVSSDQLIEQLWSGQPPPSAQKVLQGYVSQLRRGLGADSILTRSSGYVLVASDIDAGEFLRLTKLASEQNPGEAVLTLERALALWRGRAFEDFEHEEWAQLEIGRLEELRLAAIEQRIEAELELGRHAQLVPELEALVAGHPLREQLRGQLMVALYRAGRQADALDVYRRGRQVLHDELGLEPSPFLVELERQILSHDPALGTSGGRPLTLNADRAPEPRRGRRRLLIAGVVIAAVAGVALATIALATGGSTGTLLPNSLVRVDPQTLNATEVTQVGNAPDLVVASGGYLWITNNILRDVDSGALRNGGDRTLVRVDPTARTAEVVGGGLAPCGITPDPSGDVWVANCYPTTIPGLRDNVVRVDAKTLTFEETLPVPGGDGFFRGLAYGGGSLWLSQVGGGDTQNADSVIEIDPETRAQRTIQLTRSASVLAWSGEYGELLINNFDDGSLTRLQPATGARTTIEDGMAQSAYPVVDGNAVWVGDWAGPHVGRVSAVGAPRLREIALTGGSRGVWMMAAGAGAVWATTPRDGALWRIDPKTSAVTRVDLPYQPTGVAADANNVWVTVRGHS